MTATTKKTARKRKEKPDAVSFLPPSAEVVTLAGREYILAPLDEFREWDEDRALAALMTERLEEKAAFISLDEFEGRLKQKNKASKK